MFLGYSINSRAYIVFKKRTKSLIKSLKLIFNDVQTKVTPYEDEYFDLTSHNVEQGVTDNIGNNVQSVEEDENLDGDKDDATKRNEPSTSIMKNHHIENLI